MERLFIEKTEYTPTIEMDGSKQLIDIRGDSFPENTYDFYKPVISWLEEYFKDARSDVTTVNMEINYFNSSSSQLFFDFFDILEEAANMGTKLEVNWIYNIKNESSHEAGEDFLEEFTSFKINMIEK